MSRGQPGRARRLAEEAGLAASLMSRLPLPRFEVVTGATPISAVWAFPLLGGLVGLAGAAAFLVTLPLLGTAPAALAAVTAMLLVSGALHEDGLADFWDGIGAGGSRERRLEIMRDSRIGTSGAAALVIALALKAALIAAIFGRSDVPTTASAIVAAAAAARAAIAIPLALLAPARKDGLAGSGGRAGPARLLAAAAIGAVVATGLGAGAGAALLIGAALGAAAVTLVARGRIGGYTGDVLGAVAVTAELAGLAGWAIRLA